MGKLPTFLLIFAAALCREPVALGVELTATVIQNGAPKAADAVPGASAAPDQAVAAPEGEAAVQDATCVTVADAPKPPLEDTLTHLFQAIGDLKGLGFQGLLIAFVTLLVSAMKLSALRPLWDKLGAWQTATAPFLSLVLVAISTATPGIAFSWQAVAVAVTTGAGAIALHELLDALKKAPGLGPILGTLIGLAQSILGRKVSNGGAVTKGSSQGPGNAA